MSSPGKRAEMTSPKPTRARFLSIPPPIPPPGTGDLASHLRARIPPPPKPGAVDGTATGSGGASPATKLGAGGMPARPRPPVWQPSIDLSGKPRSIVRGKMIARNNVRDAKQRGTTDESRSLPFHGSLPFHDRQFGAGNSHRTKEARKTSPPERLLQMKDGSSSKEGVDVGKLPSLPDSMVEGATTNWEDISVTKVPEIQEAESAPQIVPSADTYAAPNLQTRRRFIAKQNELSAHGSHVEDLVDLSLWESFAAKCVKLWRGFHDWNNRRSLKHVVASLHALRTYHDSFLYGTIPFNIQLRTYLRTGVLGSIWHLVEISLAILSGCLYIYSTYVPQSRENWCFKIQNCISFVFLFDYLLRIYSEPVRIYYIFSTTGLVDLLSAIPIVLYFRKVVHRGDILRLLQFMRILRVFDLINKLGLIGTSVTQQILKLVVATFGAIVFDAGVFQWLEYYSAPREHREQCPIQGCITFWEAIYFIVVTIGTVGYGDIKPKTTWGQVLTCLTIAGALVYLPIHIKNIHSLAAKRPYGGSFDTRKIVGSRFLILTGSVTFPGVRSFLAEFFKPTHRQDLEIFPLRVVILGPFKPSFDFKQLLYCYGGSAEFIEGSPILQNDLERVSAEKAMAIFLLADQYAENWKVEDSAQIVRALAIHRFCRAHRERGHSRIILQVLDPETQRSAVWDEVHTEYVEVICHAKIHYRMMARSCYVKGLYTLITNLFTSELTIKYIPKKHFLTEYFHSSDNEVYPVILPSAFYDLPFEEVAEIIFLTFSSTLFGVDTLVRNKSTGQRSREVLLFPRGYHICHDDVGMVITNDLSKAFAIAAYKEQEEREKVGILRQLWNLWTDVPRMRRTNTEGIQLLDPVTGRWRRASESRVEEQSQVMLSATFKEPFGIRGPQVLPKSSECQYYVENELRAAIQTVYTSQEYPNWRVQPELKVSKDGEAHTRLKERGECSNSGHRHQLFLEQVAERLMVWPPVSKEERAHPAVLELREDLILKHLESRTLYMVAFNKPHILLCCQAGWPTNLFYFLAEHRKPRYPNPPIAILYPYEPTAYQWGSVGVFSDVFFVKGSPVYELDLMRGGVLQALKVVILADAGLPVDLGGIGLQDDLRYTKRPPAAYTSDVENIVVAANVQRLYGNSATGVTLVEMQHAEGLNYLKPQHKISLHHFVQLDLMRNKQALVHFGPPFMEGRAVSSTMLGFLLRSTFYNKKTMSIVEQLVQGGFVADEEGLSSDRQRVLDQIPVPTGYANKVYSFLFLSLLQDKGILAIGLYRVRGTLGAPTSYVLTNPPQDCIVNPDDLVYILA